jgi:dolichol-phosphate mannosyltransferase
VTTNTNAVADGKGRAALRLLSVIVGAAVVKAVLCLQLELTSVESYLWICAQHPAAGYFDYPGMAAWMIGISTFVFGNSVLGVRMVTLIVGALSAWIVFLAARRLYDDRTALRAGLLMALVPLFFAFGAEATPDAPLLLFWSATLWALAHVFAGDAPRWWYGAGLFLGLALDSKYHALFLGVGTLLFLLGSPDRRAWLRRREPYLAALIALAVFSPTLVWNARNGWESFWYQGVQRFGESPFRAKELLTFPTSQFLLLTPFVCVWAWGSGLKTVARWKASAWQDRFLAALGMPVLLFFLAVLLTRTIRGHWPAPGYVSLTILCASRFARGKLYVATIGVLLALYAAAPVVSAFVPREWRTGWAQLAAEVTRLRPDFVIGREHHLASQMGVHLRPLPATVLGRPGKSFPHWWRGAEFSGKDAVIITDPKHFPEERGLMSLAFERVEEPLPVSVVRFGGRREEYLLVRARGYRPEAAAR